jgi:predicted metal-dependent peptidase
MMTQSYPPDVRAAGRIRLAIRRLAYEFPFHAAILERLQLMARPEVGTMAVSVLGDDVFLMYHHEFILGITADELVGVLLHEIHHVLFGHVLIDPARYSDTWALTVSEEVTVNEFIRAPLPGDPIILDRFPGLPPLESTEERYRRLRKVRGRDRVGSPPAPPKGPRGNGDRAGEPPVGESKKAGKRRQGSRSGRRTQGPAAAGSSGRPAVGVGGGRDHPGPGDLGQVLDDHSVWAEARRDPERSKQAIREVVQEALLEVGSGRLPKYLRPAMEGLGIGSEPSADRYELQSGDRGHLDWRRLLRRYTGEELKVRPTFSRPPRRFPDLIGILPGQRRMPSRPRILTIIDTSASISPVLLEQIDAELAGLARRSSITVVECDSQIQRTYPYRRRLEAVQGRGGTDFGPPLEPAFLRKHRPDLVVFFTDGLGPAPVVPPPIPVIWCLVPEGKAPARWGRIIIMEESP